MNHDHHSHDHHEHHAGHTEPVESPIEYLKFVGVITGIILLSVGLSSVFGGGLEGWMANFMAAFFIVFGAFKLVNLEMFVLTYRGYDILAKRFKFWGWLFPFVELGLGAGYLFAGNNLWLNMVTIVVTGLASVGVIKELGRKSQFKCACLGTVIKLPLSKVSFVEDFVMLVMAVAMLAI